MSDKPSTKAILLAAARLEPADRQRFLESVCGADAKRLGKISAWLDKGAALQHSPLDAVIEQIHSASLSRVEAEANLSGAESEKVQMVSPQELYGRRIGNYEVVELLGQGGMGAVYLARQTSPIHRDVALKLTNLGSSSRQLLAHFEAERQTLELMNHPGIASVLDAGTTDWGSPYFVMELVQGQPITDYCNSHSLSLYERVKLFIDVCLAVQHAHHKGIVHRDLKPSNVLVTSHDGKPVIKVIDFGIARAVDLAADNAGKVQRQFLITGTPLYMSPEQTLSSGEVPDTRSDVYSMGVLLYELLAGVPPVAADRIRKMDGDELIRVIRQELPPRPSTQHVNPRSSEARQLRFELDWIIMKAIQKQPADRYPTASALADDLQRFLNGNLVLAHPANWRYRSRKWLSAHKVAFAATITIASCMVLATVISLFSARQARRARDASQSLLFAADMKIASEALRDANIRPARERLERHVPRSGETDRRNFAWYYLWNQLNPEATTIRTDDHLFEIRFSPNGELFATGHESGEVLVWRVGSDEPIYRLEKHPDIVRCIAFSPDGTRLATGSDDGQMRLWTLGQTTPTASWNAHSDDVFGIVWIDEDRFATAGDREVKIWSASGITTSHSKTQFDSNVEISQAQPTKIIGPFPGLVYAIDISPYGKHLAVVSKDFAVDAVGLITCWVIESGHELWRQFVPDRAISVAYHPMEDLLAVGTQSGDIYTIRPDSTGVRLATKIASERHNSNVYRVSFSTDGSQMVSASKDATLRVWSTDQWTCLRTVQSHQRRVYAVEFRPGSRTFASASADGTIRFFDSDQYTFRLISTPISLAETDGSAVTDGAELSFQLDSERLPQNAHYLHRKGSFLLMGDNWNNGFYFAKTGRFERLPFPASDSMETSANERHLIVSVRDGLVTGADRSGERLQQDKVSLMDLDGDALSDRVGGFGNDGRLVWQPGLSKDASSFSPPRLYGYKPPQVLSRVAKPKSGDWSELYRFEQGWGILKRERIVAGEVVEFDVLCRGLPRNSLWHMIEHAEDHPPTHVLALPGRGTVYVIAGKSDRRQIEFRSGVSGINAVHGFSSSGSEDIDCIVLADDAQRIHLLRKPTLDADDDQASGLVDFRRVQEIRSPIEVWELEVTQTASGLFSLHAAGPDGICSYTLADGQWIDMPAHSQAMDGSPWAKPLSQDIAIFESQNRQIVGSFRSPEHHVWALAVTDDGKLIATAGDGDYIRLWSSDGQLVGSFDVPRNAKHSMAFTANAQRLCAGVGDDVNIYDVRRQLLLHRCAGHENSVGRLVISPNQQVLATASDDLTVRLWSIQTGQPLAVLVGHTDVPTCIAFDHEGRLIASADRSGMVKLWDIQTGGELLELRDFKFHSQCLAFDTSTSLSILGWSDDQSSNPKLHFGRWTITLDDQSREAPASR